MPQLTTSLDGAVVMASPALGALAGARLDADQVFPWGTVTGVGRGCRIASQVLVAIAL
jgi:hypothetical protein